MSAIEEDERPWDEPSEEVDPPCVSDEPCEDPADTDHQFDVAFVLNFLGHIAAGNDPAFHFSTLLCTLEKALSPRSVRLSEHHYELLIPALQAALEGAWMTLPDYYARAQLTLGVNAARRAIEHWAKPDAQRLAGGEYVHDVRDCMRIFRNAMHTLCLINEIAERAKKRSQRRLQIVSSMEPPTVKEMDALAELDLSLVFEDTVTSERELQWA